MNELDNLDANELTVTKNRKRLIGNELVVGAGGGAVWGWLGAGPVT